MVGLPAILAHITGIPHTYDGPYLVCADVGGEPYIARWDVAALGPQPSEEQIAAAGLAVARESAVARLQAAKWDKLHGAYRDTAGHLYAIDADSWSLISGKVAMLGATGKPLPAGFFWKTAETDAQGRPICVPHSADSFLALAEEIDAWIGAVFLASERAQQAVLDASDLAGIAASEAAVVWPG